jgi:hypothetical protein
VNAGTEGAAAAGGRAGRLDRAGVGGLSGNSFGYRGSLLIFGAAAVILRRGPALKLTLRDGKTFLVTVDDAATGAALLNDLLKAETAETAEGGSSGG